MTTPRHAQRTNSCRDIDPNLNASLLQPRASFILNQVCVGLQGLGRKNVLECNPDSTNWMVRLVLIVATAAFTSFGTTSPPGHERKSQDASHSWRSTALLQPQFAAAILWAPGRYIMQQAMYLPCRGSHLHDAWM